MAAVCSEAGDDELADLLRGHAEIIERHPGLVSGNTTFVRRDGSRVPLADVSRHVRFRDTGTASSGNRAADLATAHRTLERLRDLCDRPAPVQELSPLEWHEELDREHYGVVDADFDPDDDDDQDGDPDDCD